MKSIKNIIAFMVVLIGFSCEKELPPYDERYGFIDGKINEDIIVSHY